MYVSYVEVIALGDLWANWPDVVTKQSKRGIKLGGHWAHWPDVVAKQNNQVIVLGGGRWANNKWYTANEALHNRSTNSVLSNRSTNSVLDDHSTNKCRESRS